MSEISVPAIRGGLSALLKISGHIGVLVSFAAGAWLNWRQLAALVAAAPVALCVAVACVPETPSFLVLRGRDQEAENALRWLRGDQADIRLELATIKAGVRSCKERAAVDGTACRLLVELREPVLITCGLMFFQRFSGANAFNFYVVSVFRQTFSGMNPHGAAVAVALVQLLSTLLSGLLVDTAGRLPLLVASSVLMSLALAAFGSYAYYEDVHRHVLAGQLDWVPLLCVLVFTVAFSLGISPISWLLVAELFPLEHRGLGTAMAASFSYLCAFVGVKTFVDFQDLFGLHGAFWLYAALSVGGLCFVVCLVPETKGQNLIEMDPKHLSTTADVR